VATTHWREWHAKYDDPTHPLSRRLTTVRAELRRVLAARGDRPNQLVSICAGDGRDTLPVLGAGHDQTCAVLVEFDEGLAGAARREVVALGLRQVEVRTADAGALDTYVGVASANVLFACGVFGNVTDDDLETTVASLPQLLAADAPVIWTRGTKKDGDPTGWDGDPADLVRAVFARREFVEDEFIRPTGTGFRVGTHGFAGTPKIRSQGSDMFRFIR
jgi:hypothetical protein